MWSALSIKVKGREDHVFNQLSNSKLIIGLGFDRSTYFNDLYIVEIDNQFKTEILGSYDIKADQGVSSLI